jgi:hypothetical protein
MRRKITLDEARSMVRSRAQLLDSGITERELRRAVAARELIRVHRGAYVSAKLWDGLWWEGQHLVKVVAVRAASPGAGPVYTHHSAAVLWEMPLYRMGKKPVQVRLDGERHSRVEAGVVRRDIRIADEDIVERHGFRVTSLQRTVFDVARTASLETAVGCADAALRRVSVRGHAFDEDAAAEWRADGMRLGAPGLRGVRQARDVIGFADGRAQLPGESVTRVQLRRLGFTRYDLQTHVVGAEGDDYWLDFAFPGARRFGEFDGEGKYVDPELRSTSDAEQAVLAEKRREDDIRGVTGWGFARWSYGDIRTPDALGRRLAAFGIRPPG